MKFRRGQYYIGDPCYVMNGEDWRKLLRESDYFTNDQIEFKGYLIWANSTAHGDGTYFDQSGREYPVDSGTLGIIPVSICDFQSEYNLVDGKIEDIRGLNFKFEPGHVVEFPLEFEVDYHNGKFTFGEVEIDTDPEED